MVRVGGVKECAEGTEEDRSDGQLGIRGRTVVSFDSPHEATEVGGFCSWVWQAVLSVPGVDSGKVKPNGLWLMCVACELPGQTVCPSVPLVCGYALWLATPHMFD